jgi:DNA-binding beta-propeller fold protein YncE
MTCLRSSCPGRAARIFAFSATLTAGILAAPAPTAGDEVEVIQPGIVLGLDSSTALVFDALTGTILGSVDLGTRAPMDCSIGSDGRTGYVAGLDRQLVTIDLAAAPPKLGPGPIPIGPEGRDTTLSPDGRFLAVCGNATAGLSDFVSVVDTRGRAEAFRFVPQGFACQALEFCDDGSILMSAGNVQEIRRYQVDPFGGLIEPADVLDTTTTGIAASPGDVFCAPGSFTAFFLARGPPRMASFTVPGLAPLETRVLSGTGFSAISGLVSEDGSRVYIRSNNGVVDIFGLDRATGALDPTPTLTITVASILDLAGADQMALNLDGTRLYVPENDELRIYDALTGELLASLSHPDQQTASGVCLAGAPIVTGRTVQLVIRPGSRRSVVNFLGRGSLTAAILADDDVAASDVDPATVLLGGAPILITGLGVPAVRFTDVDRDGRADLLFRVGLAEMTVSPGAMSLEVKATTFGGVHLTGSAEVSPVAPGRGRWLGERISSEAENRRSR